jgi:hypothetical protein
MAFTEDDKLLVKAMIEIHKALIERVKALEAKANINPKQSTIITDKETEIATLSTKLL